MKEADLRFRLGQLAALWRDDARKHDEERLQMRLRGDDRSAEYEVEKAEAQTLHYCAYHLIRHLEAP